MTGDNAKVTVKIKVERCNKYGVETDVFATMVAPLRADETGEIIEAEIYFCPQDYEWYKNNRRGSKSTEEDYLRDLLR